MHKINKIKIYKIFIINILCIFLSGPLQLHSQVYFTTVEMRHNFSKKWQLRFRPAAFSFPNNGFRSEIIIGKIFNPHWKVFSYTQLDFFKVKYQTGLRVDYTTSFLKNKLIYTEQLRTFVGLSKDTKFEGILISDLYYKFKPKIAFGIRNFTLESPEGTKSFKIKRSFLGPSAWYYPSKKSTFLTYYGPNLMAKKSFLFMFVYFVTI